VASMLTAWAVGTITSPASRRRACSRTWSSTGSAPVSAAADHQPAASPGDVLGGRQRGVAIGTGELAGSAPSCAWGSSRGR
jgi:hypothetical protein